MGGPLLGVCALCDDSVEEGGGEVWTEEDGVFCSECWNRFVVEEAKKQGVDIQSPSVSVRHRSEYRPLVTLTSPPPPMLPLAAQSPHRATPPPTKAPPPVPLASPQPSPQVTPGVVASSVRQVEPLSFVPPRGSGPVLLHSPVDSWVASGDSPPGPRPPAARWVAQSATLPDDDPHGETRMTGSSSASFHSQVSNSTQGTDAPTEDPVQLSPSPSPGPSPPRVLRERFLGLERIEWKARQRVEHMQSDQNRVHLQVQGLLRVQNRNYHENRSIREQRRVYDDEFRERALFMAEEAGAAALLQRSALRPPPVSVFIASENSPHRCSERSGSPPVANPRTSPTPLSAIPSAQRPHFASPGSSVLECATPCVSPELLAEVHDGRRGPVRLWHPNEGPAPRGSDAARAEAAAIRLQRAGWARERLNAEEGASRLAVAQQQDAARLHLYDCALQLSQAPPRPAGQCTPPRHLTPPISPGPLRARALPAPTPPRFGSGDAGTPLRSCSEVVTPVRSSPASRRSKASDPPVHPPVSLSAVRKPPAPSPALRGAAAGVYFDVTGDLVVLSLQRSGDAPFGISFYGRHITAVAEGGAAAAAGLVEGDEIVSVGGMFVGTQQQLQRALLSAGPEVDVEVRRAPLQPSNASSPPASTHPTPPLDSTASTAGTPGTCTNPRSHGACTSLRSRTPPHRTHLLADLREVFDRAEKRNEGVLCSRDVVALIRNDPAARRLLTPEGAEGAPPQYIVGRVLQRLGKSKGDSISWADLQQCVPELAARQRSSTAPPAAAVGTTVEWPELGIGLSSAAQNGVCVRRVTRCSASTALRWRVGDRICGIQVGRRQSTPVRGCGDVARWARMRPDMLPRTLTLFVTRRQPDDTAPPLQHLIATPGGARCFIVRPQPQYVCLGSPRRVPPQVEVVARPSSTSAARRSPRPHQHPRRQISLSPPESPTAPSPSGPGLSDPSELSSAPFHVPAAAHASARAASRSGSGPRIGCRGDAVVVSDEALTEEGAADPLELSEIVAGDMVTSLCRSPAKTPRRPIDEGSVPAPRTPSPGRTQIPKTPVLSPNSTRQGAEADPGHVSDLCCSCAGCQAVWRVILAGDAMDVESALVPPEPGSPPPDGPEGICAADPPTRTPLPWSDASPQTRHAAPQGVSTPVGAVMYSPSVTPAHGAAVASPPLAGLEGFPRLDSAAPDAATFIEGLWERYGSSLYESPARSNASLPAGQP
eukprot:Hpha_TRINITY_DN17120_c0_g1::TRINITY_DN17120_c0_g1_i1::g.146811::m.146811